METILITGGTGLVGNRLSHILKQRGYKIIHLSRKENLSGTFPAYQWDINKETIDPRALEQADYIVHLAGAGVADKMWTASRKKVIMDSRVKSAALLQAKLKEIKKQPKAIICASASGYYGNRGDKLLDESSSMGRGFLAEVVKKWEAANTNFSDSTARVALLRIGIVLSTQGGALAKMLPSYKVRTGAYFGSGEQYYSWIHIDDLCQMFVHAIETETVEGIYNAVAPNPVTNKYLAEAIGKGMNKSVFLAPVPAFALRLAMGDMAAIVLDGVNLSSNKITNSGFKFSFDDVTEALRDLIIKEI